MSEGRFQTAADVIVGWRDDVLSGRPPVLYPVGSGELARIEVGPGLVTLVGGAPGAGKTAFTMQMIVDALRLTEGLRALVCNVEMPPAVLLDRQLARLSGIGLTAIRHRELRPEHADRIGQGMATLEAIGDRLAFCRPPFNLENLAASADATGAGVLILDYVQRIPPPGDHSGSKRGAVDSSMDFLRKFADEGVAVIVVSAVGRTKDRRGNNSYTGDSLSLASFRESSELEFGADSAFILAPDVKDGRQVVLKHLKDRYGECRDIVLSFDRAIQRFETAPGAFGTRGG